MRDCLSFLQPRHARERVAVVPQRLVLLRPLAPLRIAQHELAVLGIAARLVAVQARLGADLGPDFLGKEGIRRPCAGGSAAGLGLLGDGRAWPKGKRRQNGHYQTREKGRRRHSR